MGAAIPIDWNLAQQPQSLDFVPSALEGAQAGQQLRGISALQGIDINDPDSLNKGMANLVRAGAADQASALMGLQINRGLYGGLSGFLSKVMNPSGVANPSSASPQMQPAQPQPANGAQGATDPTSALHAQIANDARAYSAASPTDQATMKPQLEAKYSALGIAKPAIDSALDAVSTPDGAAQFAATHDLHAQLHAGAQVDPAALQSTLPAGMQPPQPGDGVDPYTWAKGYLSHPEYSAYEAMLKSRMGLDLGFTARAQAIMGPEFSQEATARNAQTISRETLLGGTPLTKVMVNGVEHNIPTEDAIALAHNPSAQALGFGVDLSPEQKEEQTASGSLKGGAPGNIVNVPLPGGRSQPSIATPDGKGGYVFRPVETGGASGAGTPAAPTSSPGEITGNTISNQQLQADRQDVAGSGQRVAILKHVETLLESPQGQTGPATQMVNGWRNFLLANAPALAAMTNGGVDSAKIQSATQDELKKYMVQLAGAAAGAYGQGTNEKLAIAASGNANPDISNLANRDVTRMNLALERSKQAKMAAWEQSGQSGDSYAQFSSNWGRTVDPRAFMLDVLSPAERRAMLSSVTTPAGQRAMLAGKHAAENAGVYSDSDIPR